MKAASSLLSAASAVALSAGIVLSGAGAFQLASTTAAQAAVVSSVSVNGNVRIDADTIRNHVGIRPGQSFSNADIDEAVKRLFATGLFSDVRISQSGSTLVVTVEEHAIVNQVLFQGNRKIKDVDLYRQIQLKPRSPYSAALAEADVETIRQAYARIGRDDAIVTSQMVDLGQNRVNVVFNIEEGGRTKIASITFEGNNAYSDGRLRDVIATKRSNLLSFITRNDIYDEDRLRADEEALRRFYYNRGYADFHIVSAYGELDEAANAYNVRFVVEEGQRYRFGSIDIESTVPGIEEAALTSQLKSRSGDWYSAKDVEDTIIALSERVAGQGYAFAQVTPRGDRNFENQTISVVYTIDQGPRTYVERIEIRGNERTRDYVIRREFDISEGDAFNQVLVQRTKRRLEALNYFEQVNISTVPGSEPDQVVLMVELVEKSTGELSIGGGYSTGGETAGFSVEGSITERNFLGRGQSIRFSAAGGVDSRDYTFSFTEPYFLGRRISAGFDIFRQTRSYTNYKSKATGGTVRFGLPITQHLAAQLAYNYSRETYEYTDRCDVNEDGVLNPPPLDPGAECNISPILQNAIENQSPWIRSSVTAGVVYNTIDNMQNPRSGLYANVATEFAGLGGDAEWVRFTGRATYYHTLSEELDLVGLVSVGGGHVEGFSGGGLRVFDHFQGSTRMIRGFKHNGFGPIDTRTNDHLGGTTYFNASTEVQFPMPMLAESLGIRGAFFADAATLYGNSLAPGFVAGTSMEWRASVGASLIWASPFGPLRVDYAVPVMKESTDRTQNFNFGMSTRF